MIKTFFITFIVLTSSLQSFAQHLGMTFQVAEKKGLSYQQLDSIYTSAVNSDTSLAVFKPKKNKKLCNKHTISFCKISGISFL